MSTLRALHTPVTPALLESLLHRLHNAGLSQAVAHHGYHVVEHVERTVTRSGFEFVLDMIIDGLERADHQD